MSLGNGSLRIHLTGADPGLEMGTSLLVLGNIQQKRVARHTLHMGVGMEMELKTSTNVTHRTSKQLLDEH